ncbi:MAG: hypothetical protein ACR2HM_11365 [Acidimicrobiales bacterium]
MPTGTRVPAAGSPWAPAAEGEFFIDDLLIDRSATMSPAPAPAPAPATSESDSEEEEDAGGGGANPAGTTGGRRPDAKARIAADQARRRRSRRGGRGGN